MKKITFIYPAIGKKPGRRYIGTWKMEPLPIAVLAGLTPASYERELFDDRLELIDYDTPTDLVAITVETYTARRAYAVAAQFRRRGRKVVMGGYHPTHLPDEALEHADAVVTGNAESVWGRLLDDAAHGRLQRRYDGGIAARPGMPDRRIFARKPYLPIGLVETGRGCPHTCEFCHITSYYDASYHPRPVEDIVRDVVASKKRFFFFVDDNLVARRSHLLELCRALEPLNIVWSSQGTLTMARDPELLRAMKKSGCCLMLIGFESLDPSNLAQMGKEWSARLGERNALVRAIHDAGIHVYATFIFGFDNDAAETMQSSVDFALQHDFFYAAFNHLLPFPGTPLYARLAAGGRLVKPRWWLDGDYRYGDIAFRPTRIDGAELSSRCVAARKQFFGLGSIVRRGARVWQRSPSAGLMSVFVRSNWSLSEEVEGKLGLPLGDGLDQLPK
jgi:radical SAM superfamily enzyme YgiQ (UPF0313 family)